MFIFGAWCVVFWAACHALGRSDRKALRYRACLSNIARLERELFPEYFPKTEWLDDGWRPGAIWRVDDINSVRPYVEIQRSPYSFTPNGIPGKVGPG